MSLKNIGSILNTLDGIDDLTAFFVESEDAAKKLVEQIGKLKNPEKILKGFAEADDLLEFAGFSKSADAIDDVGDAVKGASKSMSGGTSIITGMKSAFTGLISTVKPFLPLLAKVAAGIAAVAAVAYVLDELVLTSSEANEEFKNSFDAYNNSVSEIKNLNSELETTQERINELESMDSLTITETEELNKLKQQNKLLEQQILNKEKLAAAQQKAAATDASIALNTKIVEYNNGSYNPTRYSKKVVKAEEDIKKLNELQQQYNDLILEQSKLDPNEEAPFLGKNQYEKVSDRIDKIRQQLEDSNTTVSSSITEISDQYFALFDDNGKLINEQDAQLAESIERLLTLYNEGEEALKVFDLFNAKGVEKTREEFAELAEQGELTVEKIEKEFPNIAAAAEMQNIPLETLIGYFQTMGDEAANASGVATGALYDVLDAIKEADSAFNKANSALESENQGSAYDSMREMAKKAKELKKSGDIGTDDFKAIAAMFSPSGAEDVTNFAENLKKINRYFTEDNSGLVNFLKDLEAKDFAKYNKETKEWTYSIDDLEKAARDMGMGFEPFMAMFGKLEDKGFYNDFFTTQEEGTTLLTKLTNDLYDAEKELWDLEHNDPGNTTAIEEKKKEIEQLKERIDATTDSLIDLLNKSPEERLEETKKNREAIQSSIEAYNESIGKFSQSEEGLATLETWREQIASAANDTNFEIVVGVDGKLEIKNIEEVKEEIESKTNPIHLKGNVDLTNRKVVNGDAMQRAGWTGFTSSDTTSNLESFDRYTNESGNKSILITPILPNGEVLSPQAMNEYAQKVLDTGEDPEKLVIATFDGETASRNAYSYANILSKVERAYKSGDETQIKYLNSLSHLSKQELEAVDLLDNSTSAIETDLKTVMEQFNISAYEAQYFIDVLSDMGLITIDTTNVISSLEDLENYLEVKDYNKIVKIIGEDNASAIVTMWNTLQADDKFATLSASDQATYVIDLWNSLDAEQREIVLAGGPEAEKIIEDVNKTKLEDKDSKITVNNRQALNSIDAVDKALDDLDGKRVDTWTYNHQKTVNENSLFSRLFSADGTFADGTLNSYANGRNVAIRKPQEAVVNELGNEGLVRNGILHEITGGTQKIKLKPGDIIFNHKQMEELKKNGYVTSGGGRGKLIGKGSFADGTIPAYSTGGGPSLDENSSKKSSSKSSSDSTKKETEKLFDWIERRIEKFQRVFDKWISRAEQVITKGFVDSYYKKASQQLSDLMNTQVKAYDYYLQKANAISLSSSYKSKVKDGSISLEEITNESTQEAIDKFTDLWDKAQEALTAFEEAADQFYNIPLDAATRKIELFSDAIDILEAKIDNAIGATNKNKLIDQQITRQADVLSAQNIAKVATEKNLAEAAKQLNTSSNLKGLSDANKTDVQNRIKVGNQVNLALFSEGSDAWKAAVRYNEALQANTEATNEYNKTLQETIALERELAKSKFDNIAEEYERKIEMLDHGVTALDNKIAEIEARGQAVSVDYYKEQLKLEEQKKAILLEEKAALEEQIKTIPEGTEEWYDAYAAIQDVSSEISECTQNTYELNKAINDAHFALFDNIHDEIDRLKDEQDFLREMMSHEKMVDDDGNLTDAGYANLASLTASLELSKRNVANDKAMIDRLDRMIESGELSDGELTFNSMEELEERREEMYDQWRDDIKETYDLENEIYDLQKERYQAQIDAMQEIVDSKKEALQAEKD